MRFFSSFRRWRKSSGTSAIRSISGFSMPMTSNAIPGLLKVGAMTTGDDSALRAGGEWAEGGPAGRNHRAVVMYYAENLLSDLMDAAKISLTKSFQCCFSYRFCAVVGDMQPIPFHVCREVHRLAVFIRGNRPSKKATPD